MSHPLGGEAHPNMALVGIDTKPFIIPNKNNKRKRTKVVKNPDSNEYNVDVRNSFDVLSDSDTDTADEIVSEPKQKIALPPPFVVYNYIQDHVSSVNKIRAKLTDDIAIKYKGNRIILQTYNKEDYSTVKQIITDSKMEYHTYTPKEDKDHKLVLKNLPPSISVDEIKTDLINKNIEVKSVIQITKKMSDNTIKPLPLYIVTVSNKIKIKDVYNIKKVCFCVISWEKYKSKFGITQCYKCQSFNHIAVNCYKKPKCVICAGSHLKADCDVTNSKDFKCANCSGNHLANSKDCSFYVRRLNDRQTKSNSQTLKNLANKQVFNLRDEDFPSVSKNPSVQVPTVNWPSTSSTTTSTGQESLSDVVTLVKTFLQNINMKQIIENLKKFLIKIANSKDNISKLGLIIEFIVDLLG